MESPLPRVPEWAVIGFQEFRGCKSGTETCRPCGDFYERHYSGIVQKFLKIYIGKLNLSKDVWGDLFVTKL